MTGFESTQLSLLTLQPVAQGFTALGQVDGPVWHYCKNHEKGACNWLVDSHSSSGMCCACELNRYIPNLVDIENLEEWRTLEFAKHRLVYNLLRLRLPVQSKQHATDDSGIHFDFINPDHVVPDDAETMTGHASGKITINMEEADPVQREQTRVNMKERYRTLLGHLRHEVGHYYWDVLVAQNPDNLVRYRHLFGDESRDYGEALQQHYEQGAPQNWNQQFVSTYASSHPWEDWAETWSHYLHLTDMMETAVELGVSLQPSAEKPATSLTMMANYDAYGHIQFDDFLDQALKLAFASNCLSRSVGQPDLYPFVITPAVKEKMAFVHEVIKDAGAIPA